MMRAASMLSLLFFACFASARAQDLIPTVCYEQSAPQSGTTTLAAPAGVNNGDIRVSSPVPLFATLVINPGGANEETTLAVYAEPSDPYVIIYRRFVGKYLTKAHSAGETIRFYHNGLIAQFGYNNTTNDTINLDADIEDNNFFYPGVQSYPNQTQSFLPGIHQTAFALNMPPPSLVTLSIYWFVGETGQVIFNKDTPRCGAITYQGRLTDAGAAANGQYDLQFTAYAASTGGTAQSEKIIIENAQVTNGVFTVHLDFGSSLSNNNNAQFLEIGVRAGTSTGAFTVLTPRQPITSVPYAINADFAANATNATNATQLNGIAANQYVLTTDPRLSSTNNMNFIQNTTTQQTANFNISGNGTVGGNLTATGTISSGCRSGFTAIAGGRLCVSAIQTAASFYGSTGAVQTCTNMQARVGNSADVMLTFSQSGFNYFAGQTTGWLADIIGDNVRSVWFANGP